MEFVERQRPGGHEANVLDIRVDDFGGPYDASVADAVPHHLSRRQFDEVLERARRAVVPAGIVAFTLKEGVGDGWSHAKIGLPQHFTYWREADVRSALERDGPQPR